MSTVTQTIHGNVHLTAIQAAFSEATSQVEWLVIAHNDSHLIKSLHEALAGTSAAVLEVSQDRWDFTGSDLPEAIQWALDQGGVSNLVLVGHAHAGGADARLSFVEPGSPEGDAADHSGYRRLVGGVQRSGQHNRSAQNRFAEQLKQLQELPAANSRQQDGELSVYGLFYRDESGLFLLYDAENDSFHPLLG